MNSQEYKELQGQRQTAKKKISQFNLTECDAEIQRLERCNHQNSRYYNDIVKHRNKLKNQELKTKAR